MRADRGDGGAPVEPPAVAGSEEPVSRTTPRAKRKRSKSSNGRRGATEVDKTIPLPAERTQTREQDHQRKQQHGSRNRRMKFIIFSGLLLGALAVLAPRILRFGQLFCATQCFTRRLPPVHNFGLREIPVRNAESLTASTFEAEYVARGYPLKILNATHGMEANTKWTLDYFKTKYPSYVVDYPYTLKDYVYYIRKFEARIRQYNAKPEADRSKLKMPQPEYHSHDERFFAKHKTLWEDTNQLDFVRARSFKKDGTLLSRAVRLLMLPLKRIIQPELFEDWIQAVWWLGPTGSITKLHYDDDPCSILFQFMGKKEVTLFSPEQAKFLYPKVGCSKMSEYGTRFAHADPSRPNYKAFPLMANATGMTVHLEPGDALYIPSGWWHQVIVTEGPAISVAGRSYTLCEGLSYVPNMLVGALVWLLDLDVEAFCINPDYINDAKAFINQHAQHTGGIYYKDDSRLGFKAPSELL